MSRTLEEQIKFDHGLTVGCHGVTIRHQGTGRTLSAIVEITVRGKVNLLTRPGEGDMYTSWHRLEGNNIVSLKKAAVIVWAVRDKTFQDQYAALFDSPVATLEIGTAQ